MADSGACGGEPVCEVVKEGPVKYGGKQMTLLLNTKGLTLRDNTSSGDKNNKGLDLSWCDVITAQTSKKFKGGDEKKGFCIHYMEKQPKNKLQAKIVDILSTEEPADIWIDTICRQCTSVENRPRKLFVLVNPIGGSHSGQKVYDKKVRPIFEMAQIQADVHFTERAKHALEIGENQDFSLYDGIVVLGGDGTYHEILQGLTIQTQKAAGLDYNDVNTTLKTLSKPIAIIPTGTGNGASGFFNGIVDIETAILRVVKGEQHKATILSVHSNAKLFAICGLLVGYGFYADLIKRTDELRWMRKARYPYALLAAVFGKAREFQCSLEYRLAPDTPCEDGPGEGASRDIGETTAISNETTWIKYDGKSKSYTGVSAFIASVEKKDDKAYVNAYPDHISLLVDQGCSTINVFKFLFKQLTGKETEPLPPNLEVLKKVQGYRMKITSDAAESGERASSAKARARELEQYLNSDGELKQLEVLDFEISLIPSFVPVYGIYMAQM